MEPSEAVYTLEDVDGNSGEVKASYVLSKSKQGLSAAKYRIDETTRYSMHRSGKAGSTNTSIRSKYVNYVKEYLSTLFLPIGYPHSVTKDYTDYQIYDSIQAFASSIAGLLSSRAVLQSLDVISSSSSGHESIAATSTSAATAATLLSVLQTTLSNVTSILFASRAAPRISSEVKYYRFLADVVNDAAFILDLLAPALASTSRLPSALSLLPLSPRAFVLCTSSMLRAVCGVAGGSSKAVLSTHFAHNNPESVGDLNAKDGSQETVVGLVGMWVGGIVVSRVESTTATWCWMIALLCMHLWANYRAVRSVRLKSLNRERASMVCRAIFACEPAFQDHGYINVETVGRDESVLGIAGLFKSALTSLRGLDDSSNAWRRWKIGITMQQFLQGLELRSADQQVVGKEAYISELVEVFKVEAYLLHWNYESNQALVIFKVDARPADQLKAWLHATCIQRRAQSDRAKSPHDESKSDSVSILTNTLNEVRTHWKKCCLMLEHQGWDLSTTNLENVPSRRLRIS